MTATESLFFGTINDFCNKIGTKQTFGGARCLSAFGGKADIDLSVASSAYDPKRT